MRGILHAENAQPWASVIRGEAGSLAALVLLAVQAIPYTLL